MESRTYLRVEGLAIALAALAGYLVVLDGPLWVLAVLALAPDLSMVGYLAGPVVGARTYNVAHVYVWPLVLLAGFLLTGVEPLAWGGAVWAGHIGIDRAAGYGLKEESGFGETHLGRL
ncbi:DUF4260 domain-containing protein [Halorarum halobium]|uniref:DUF4260 domain-containing protein n=1 Tax=Halorarum halobium TaxID=3075121 RepID=UPI0028AC51F9|nr:DUF4260 domain-containing protein [Halobaculum sp. XH14]